jgi:hypothetical protein
MGVWYENHAMIGVKLNYIPEPSTTRSRGCSHPESTGNFCSVCGKPMWNTTTDYYCDDFEALRETIEGKLSEKFGKYVVVSEGEPILKKKQAPTWVLYVGYGLSFSRESNEGSWCKALEYSDIKTVLQEILGDLWTNDVASTFGFWGITIAR